MKEKAHFQGLDLRIVAISCEILRYLAITRNSFVDSNKIKRSGHIVYRNMKDG